MLDGKNTMEKKKNRNKGILRGWDFKQEGRKKLSVWD